MDKVKLTAKQAAQLLGQGMTLMPGNSFEMDKAAYEKDTEVQRAVKIGLLKLEEEASETKPKNESKKKDEKKKDKPKKKSWKKKEEPEPEPEPKENDEPEKVTDEEKTEEE